MSQADSTTYIHGFTAEEQQRLIKQAEFLEFQIFRDVNFSSTAHVLEVGCGVGAQGEILLRRFPKLQITGIDLNDRQIEALRSRLANQPEKLKRYTTHVMDAAQIKFEASSFDGAFLCWILEHVPSPSRILSEVRRVLKPGSPIVISEVMNSSFFLHPYSPAVWKYWMIFNDFQIEKHGDPFVGAKLGNLLLGQGFKNIHTKVKTLHWDNRQPSRRKECVDYWTELLLSVAPQLLSEKLVDESMVQKVREELQAVAHDPNAVFYYSFIQAHAEV